MQDNIYFGLDLLPAESLEHYGIPRKSGRYPWGSGENPYHHGASAPGGGIAKKESYFKRRAAMRASVKKAKVVAAERKVKEEEERVKQERAKKKQEALASGDPKELAPYVRDLSDQELKDAVSRLRFENQFAQLLAEAPKDPTAAERVKKKLDKMNEFVTTGTNTWNNVAKIYNAFSGSDEKLPIIGDKDGNKSKSSKDNDRSSKQRNTSSSPKNKSQQSNQTNSNQIPKSAPTSKQNNNQNDSQLHEKWSSEIDEIAEGARREAQKEIRRTMATEFSKQLKDQSNAELQKKWLDEANEIANQAKSEARKEFRREMADILSDELKKKR